MRDEIDLERFGAAVASTLGVGPSRSTLNAQREQVLAMGEHFEALHQRSRWSGWLPWTLSAAAATAVLCGVLALRGSEPGLNAEFAGAHVSERSQLEARDQQRPLSFSDGSQMLLAPGAAAEIATLSHARAEFRLMQGQLEASIRKHTGTTWTIAAGPYSVRVVGTRFSVGWDPHAQRLQVKVSEGRVRVFGGDLGAGVALNAGAKLERTYRADPPAAPSAATEAAPSAATEATPSAATEATPSVAEAMAASANLNKTTPETSVAPLVAKLGDPAANPPPNAGAWLGAAGKGKYREALELAEKQGFDQLLGSLSENDLLTLANSARFAGDGPRARRALNKLRARFPGRPAAELAALYQARVSEDLEHRPDEAVRWLRVFLQESPAGDLAAGARANLMSLLLARGDAGGASDVARDYLRYHPSGPYASKARSLLTATQH